MYKSEIIIAISERTGLKEADSEKALKAFIEVVTEALVKGEKVQRIGLARELQEALL